MQNCRRNLLTPRMRLDNGTQSVFPVRASETISGFRLEEGFGLIAVTEERR